MECGKSFTSKFTWKLHEKRHLVAREAREALKVEKEEWDHDVENSTGVICLAVDLLINLFIHY